ncbi:MAG: glutaminase [Marinifilaceae bacterium]|nr:glutaminase [Marinilabiliaceae bacterium JC040]MCT4599442.1 glutaminase [Marinifilaceae bacterium]
MNCQEILNEIIEDVRPLIGKGNVADYIPALKNVKTDSLGIAVVTMDGKVFEVGDSQANFSIQSISKVFTLAMAFSKFGDDLWKSVGKEPSGNPFNSLVQLEYENGIPRNPFINAGALVITDKVLSSYRKPKFDILDFVRRMADNDDIYYDKNVAQSEKDEASRNLALAHFMQSFENIENDVDRLIDVYCHHCALSMNCVDLAKSFMFLANHGINPYNNEKVLTSSQAKRLNALMLTCGCYDESGDFAFRVGLPGKSGVGGGIVALIPGELVIAVWAPELNNYGNSLVGFEALERFTTKLNRSIF